MLNPPPEWRKKAKLKLERVHLRDLGRHLYRCLRTLRQWPRALLRANSRIVQRYFAQTDEPKLHLGCGDCLLEGWLNSDLFPCSPRVLRLDATRPFPFASNTFAYAYSEHLIGLLATRQAKRMLRECFRVLAPGGKVRICTPDLAFLIDLCGPQPSALQERYIEWASGQSTEKGRAVVINNMGEAYGPFVYDEPHLRGALEDAGFKNIVSCDLNQSDDAALRGLANEKRLPDGFLRLESLTMEGSKPF